MKGDARMIVYEKLPEGISKAEFTYDDGREVEIISQETLSKNLQINSTENAKKYFDVFLLKPQLT
jgi:hypothetical protein